jgi:hypothetical protein
MAAAMPQVAHGRRRAVSFHAGFCYEVQPGTPQPQC